MWWKFSVRNLSQGLFLLGVSWLEVSLSESFELPSIQSNSKWLNYRYSWKSIHPTCSSESLNYWSSTWQLFLWQDHQDDGSKVVCWVELSRTTASTSSLASDRLSPSPWKTLSGVWLSSGSAADDSHRVSPGTSSMSKFRKLSISFALLMCHF